MGSDQGSHCGVVLIAFVSVVTGLPLAPLGSTCQMFHTSPESPLSLPSKARGEKYAIRVPSADHTPSAAPTTVSRVSGLGFVPSAFIIQRLYLSCALSLPSKARVEVNVSLVPSGEKASAKLCARVRLVSAVNPVPSG